MTVPAAGSGAGRPRPVRGTASVARVAALATCALATLLALPAQAAQQPAQPAVADHYPNVSAVVTCQGMVNFGVVSWPGIRDDPATSDNERVLSRTTQQVAISYSVDGGVTFQDLPLDPRHNLNTGDDFSFQGSFALPVPHPRSVMVRVRAASNWADGTGLGQAKTFGPARVPACAVGAGGGQGGVPAGFTRTEAAVAPERPVPRFERGAVIGGGVATLALLLAGLWARGRVARP